MIHSITGLKMKKGFQLRVHNSISGIDKEQYNAIVDPQNPFLEYEFLEALEKSGCVGERTTWDPRYIVLEERGKIVGALTAYIRLDSYGEYIFDWEWARAFESSGLSYYPKMVVAIPFTPATGVRILVHPEYSFEDCAESLVKRLIDLSIEENCSSIHFLFLTDNEKEFLETMGFMTRKTHQYHWKNKGYKTFEDFLSDMRSGRKKQIRKERKFLEDAGLQIKIVEGNDIENEHMDAIWGFYTDTHSKKWGSAYLNRNFFDLMYENFRHRIVLVMAKDGDIWAGGTFNIVKNESLFGRYWGAVCNYKNLHFECCFYKLIDYSIERGVQVFEAGAQGEHKFLRGFGAVPTYSSHYIFHSGARVAIKNYLKGEIEYTDNLIRQYNRQSPLKYLYGK